MATRFLFFFVIITQFASPLSAQKKLQKSIERWQKCVVNLETEGSSFSPYQIEQKLEEYRVLGYTPAQLDSVKNILNTRTNFHTGTAVYVKDGNRRYLITAKHVLLDSALTRQKIFEKNTGIINWKDVEAIYSRISIRTPVDASEKNIINNRAVYNYLSSPKNITPYILIPDSAENDLAIISLQEKNYKLLDELLRKDGYSPVSIDKICSLTPLEDGDDVYTIGFPENISVVGKASIPNNTKLYQLNQIINPFTSFGKVSMSNDALNFFYADLTISFGNSGGPVIKNDKLVGIVSGINKYSILSDGTGAAAAGHFYGVGHLVKVVKCNDILKYLKVLQAKENDPSFNK